MTVGPLGEKVIVRKKDNVWKKLTKLAPILVKKDQNSSKYMNFL